MDRFCNKCGSKVNEDDIFCYNCGASLKGAETEVIEKTQIKYSGILRGILKSNVMAFYIVLIFIISLFPMIKSIIAGVFTFQINLFALIEGILLLSLYKSAKNNTQLSKSTFSFFKTFFKIIKILLIIGFSIMALYCFLSLAINEILFSIVLIVTIIIGIYALFAHYASSASFSLSKLIDEEKEKVVAIKYCSIFLVINAILSLVIVLSFVLFKAEINNFISSSLHALEEMAGADLPSLDITVVNIDLPETIISIIGDGLLSYLLYSLYKNVIKVK